MQKSAVFIFKYWMLNVEFNCVVRVALDTDAVLIMVIKHSIISLRSCKGKLNILRQLFPGMELHY